MARFFKTTDCKGDEVLMFEPNPVAGNSVVRRATKEEIEMERGSCQAPVSVNKPSWLERLRNLFR